MPKTVGAGRTIYGCKGVSIAPTEEKGLEIFKVFKHQETFTSLSLGYQTGRFLYYSWSAIRKLLISVSANKKLSELLSAYENL